MLLFDAKEVLKDTKKIYFKPLALEGFWRNLVTITEKSLFFKLLQKKRTMLKLFIEAFKIHMDSIWSLRPDSATNEIFF